MKTIKTFDPSDVHKYFKDQLPPDSEELIRIHKQFTDELFLTSKMNDFQWKRLSEIKQNFKLAETPISTEAITTSINGNKKLLSYLHVLSQCPELITEKFRVNEFNTLGYYEVILFIDGQWQIVIVDDYVPWNGDFVSARPFDNEIWLVLLEKAWAKVNGGYAFIKQEEIPFSVISGCLSKQYPNEVNIEPYIYNVPIEKKMISKPLVFNLELYDDSMIKLYALFQEERYNKEMDKNILKKGKVFYVLGKYNDKKEVEKIYSDATNTNSLKDTFMTKGMYILWCYIVFPKGEQSINYEQYKSYSIHIQSKSKIEIEFKDFDSSMQVLEHICCSFYKLKHPTSGYYCGKVEELANGFCVNVAYSNEKKVGNTFGITNENQNNKNFVSGRNDFIDDGFVIWEGAEVAVICFEPDSNSKCSYKLEVSSSGGINITTANLPSLVDKFFGSKSDESKNKIDIIGNNIWSLSDAQQKEKSIQKRKENEKKNNKVRRMVKRMKIRNRLQELKEKISQTSLSETPIVDYSDSKEKMKLIQARFTSIAKYIETAKNELKQFFSYDIYSPTWLADFEDYPNFKLKYPDADPPCKWQKFTEIKLPHYKLFSELDPRDKQLTGRGYISGGEYYVYLSFENRAMTGKFYVHKNVYRALDFKYFEGYLKDGEIEGEGTIFIDDKIYYKGNFEHSKIKGVGKIYYGDGNEYNGTVEEYQRKGVGMLQLANQKGNYIGEYVDDNCVRQYQISEEEMNGILEDDFIAEDLESTFILKEYESFAHSAQQDQNEENDDSSSETFEKLLAGTSTESEDVEQFRNEQPLLVELYKTFNGGDCEKTKRVVKLQSGDKNVYIGQAKEGNVFEGKGAWRKGNKIYVGIWKDGQPSGEISIYNTKGNLIYKGEYKDNAENGKGIKYLNKIGEYLIGDFKNGKFTNGRLYSQYGLVYKEVAFTSEGTIDESDLNKKPFIKTTTSRTEELLSTFEDDYPEVMPKLRCLVPFEETFTNPKIKWDISEISDTVTYIGQLEKKKQHGIGAMIYDDSAPYKYAIGYWRNNQLERFGTLYSKDWEVIYEGEFRDGKKEGYGIDNSKQDKYLGYFVNDKRKGKGVSITETFITEQDFDEDSNTGDVYTINKAEKTVTVVKVQNGNCVSNETINLSISDNADKKKKQRESIPLQYDKYINMFLELSIDDNEAIYLTQGYQEKEGKIYIGEMSFNGMKNGRGVLIDSFYGTFYVGYFKYDLQEGQGRLYDLKDDKVIYQGNFHWGKPYGKGHFYFYDPEEFEVDGEFNEKGEGKGTQKFKNSTWIGEFYGWMKNGNGALLNKKGKFLQIKRYELNKVVH